MIDKIDNGLDIEARKVSLHEPTDDTLPRAFSILSYFRYFGFRCNRQRFRCSLFIEYYLQSS